MPNTPSLISHTTYLFSHLMSQTLQIHAEGPLLYGTPGLWLPPAGATYHNLDAEKSNSICLCRK